MLKIEFLSEGRETGAALLQAQGSWRSIDESWNAVIASNLLLFLIHVPFFSLLLSQISINISSIFQNRPQNHTT